MDGNFKNLKIYTYIEHMFAYLPLSSTIVEYSRFGSYRLFHHHILKTIPRTPTNVTDVILLSDQ